MVGKEVRLTNPRRRRRDTRKKRRLVCQTLEIRRLLVGEGAAFELSENVSSSGLGGTTSAVIRWGDGSETPAASVSGGGSAGPLKIRFDYSLDTGGFFSGAGASRRVILQQAADALVQRFADDLAAIRPAGKAEWIPAIFHPSIGAAGQLTGNLVDLTRNLPVAANEIVVYAGARDLPGNARGVGGTGSARFPAASNLTPAELQQIVAFREIVNGRGEPGALTSPQTDVGPWGGSISFDNQTDWYFGTDAELIEPEETDFYTIAIHELAHVLGFGISRVGATTSWDRLAGPSGFSGAKARAAFAGTGNVPLEDDHWASSVRLQFGQATAMEGVLPLGTRQLFTPLDFAAMDDIGWELLDLNTLVTAQHRYADNGTYPVSVVLTGSRSGTVVHDVGVANITNVAPTLTAPDAMTAFVGETISIVDIGKIIDPGFRNASADPPGDETFNYSIRWNDGSPLDEGVATIDAVGNSAGAVTRASFDGQHRYDSAGTYTVVIRAVDDDGGPAQATFTITVTPPPSLSLQLADASIKENAGTNATALTVSRSGPVIDRDETVNLKSEDESEAIIPTTITIPAGATSARVDVTAVDDASLDGDINVRLSASGSGLQPAAIDLIVLDHETLTAFFSATEIDEDAAGELTLTLQRSNTDVASELNVDVGGGDRSELGLANTLTIPAQQQSVVVAIDPVDDQVAELTRRLAYSFSAIGYVGTTAEIDLLDDEPPLFQNPSVRFDVNVDQRTSAADALRIINELSRRGGPQDLDPNSTVFDNAYVDVNGDYRLSALDALLVINQLARLPNVSENLTVNLFDDTQPIDAVNDQDDDRLRLFSFVANPKPPSTL